MTNKTLEAAKAKVEALEKVEAEYTATVAEASNALESALAAMREKLATANKSVGSILKAQIKRIERAYNVLVGAAK